MSRPLTNAFCLQSSKIRCSGQDVWFQQRLLPSNSNDPTLQVVGVIIRRCLGIRIEKKNLSSKRSKFQRDFNSELQNLPCSESVTHRQHVNHYKMASLGSSEKCETVNQFRCKKALNVYYQPQNLIVGSHAPQGQASAILLKKCELC